MWGWHLRRGLVTQPSCRQDAIGIGQLLADIAAVDPLLSTAADPGGYPEIVQPLEGIGDSAFAEIGLPGNCRIGRIQSAGRVVEEIKQEDMQDLQAAGADGAPVHAWLVGLPVKIPGAVPELESHLLRHWGELDWFCGALSPDRKFSIRLLGHNRQARQDLLGECGHRVCVLGLSRGALEAGDGTQFPASKWDLLFCQRYTRLEFSRTNLGISDYEFLRRPLPGAVGMSTVLVRQNLHA